MEKEIVEIICKNLKWYEKVAVRMFKKIFLKAYNETRKSIVNAVLK